MSTSTIPLLRSNREKLYKFNVVLLGVAFFFLFSAYNTAQNLITSVLKAEHFESLGFYSLCLIYSGAAIATFFATSLVRRVGERVCLIGSGSIVVLYSASLIYVVPGIVYVVSGVWGLGSGLLWTAQGSFLARNSNDTNRSANAGLFWSIFQLSAIFGNFGAFVLADVLKVNFRILMATLTALAIIGWALLFLLKKIRDDNVVIVDDQFNSSYSMDVPASNVSEEDPASSMIGVNVVDQQSTLETFKQLFQTKPIYLLFVLNFFIGYELSYTVGSWPTVLETKKIGLYMTLFGVGEVVGGFVWGRVSPLIGRKLLMFVAMLLYLSAITGSLLFKFHELSSLHFLAPYITTLLFGLSDSAFNVLYLSTTQSAFIPAHHTMAYAVFQFAQTVSSAAYFAFAPQFPLPSSDVLPISCAALCVVAAIAFMCTDLNINKTETM